MTIQPPRSIFRPHDQYAKLLSGAHRRQVTPLATPAVTRHLAFWNPEKLGPEEPAGTGTETAGAPPAAAAPGQDRVAAADRCVTAVYRHVKALSENSASAVRAVETNSKVEVDGRSLLALFGSVLDAEDVTACNCPEALRADSYRAIRIWFLWHGIRTTLSFELHTEFMTLTTALDLSSPKSQEEIERIIASPDPVPGELYRALKSLSQVSGVEQAGCPAIHRALYHSVWERVEDEILSPLRDLQSNLGPNFVDFRGVSLSPKGALEEVEFGPPFAGIPCPGGTGRERASACKLDDFDALWKFVTCALPNSTEFTLSRFLDDRAFYATALGFQSDILATTQSPLYYLLYEDTLNPWQLGRMVYRVHRAGTARIAAIMHYDVLRRAKDILEQVDATLESATWAMSRFADETQRESLRQSLIAGQRKVETGLSKLSQLRLDGTLEARIERSRYYVRQFERVTSALRIKRVVGFQPYDEFVNQRMGAVFESIDGLGRSFERIKRDRAALVSRIQTLDSLRNEELIADAQRIADIALSCAIAPYYVGSITAHALAGLAEPRGVWVVATLFGLIMFVLIRLAHPRPDRHDRLQRLLETKVGAVIRSRLARFLIALILAIPLGVVVHEKVLPAEAAVSTAAPEHP